MSHNINQVVLGATPSSCKTVPNAIGNIEAGKIVRRKTDGTISVAKADGEAIGISLGKHLSGLAGITHYVAQGLKVPIMLTDAFVPVAGTQVFIDDVTGMAKASGAGVTGVNAVYFQDANSGAMVKEGIKEDGTGTVRVALIDFIGGL